MYTGIHSGFPGMVDSAVFKWGWVNRGEYSINSTVRLNYNSTIRPCLFFWEYFTLPKCVSEGSVKTTPPE
jgi:hypothetical protein